MGHLEGRRFFSYDVPGDKTAGEGVNPALTWNLE
jgi:hypothetical protein